MAEGPALEKRYPAKSGIVGSNPTLSASSPNGAQLCNGEMSELAEGARLEIVCAVYSSTEGSNPSLSAIFSNTIRGNALSGGLVLRPEISTGLTLPTV